MKFAICNEMFGEMPFDEVFKLIRDCGYQGVELAPFTIAENVYDISVDRLGEIRRQLASAGLEMVGLHWLLAKTKGYHLTTPNSEIRRATGEYIASLAQLCADLGGKVLVLGSPEQRNLLQGCTHEEGMQLAADCLQTALPTLERCGVTLALEPLGPQETDFLNRADQGVELAKMVDSKFVQLHLDVKAMSSESTPIPKIIKDHKKYVAHFHANDPNLLGPGMGSVDFVPIFKALKDISYDGWISVEVFDYKPGPEKIARDSIAYMKKCLRKAK